MVVRHICSAYSANEDERRVALVEDMLVQVRHAIVPDGNVREEWKCPGVSSTNDERVDL